MLDKNKIYRYLGYNPNTNILTNDIIEMVDEGIEEINKIATCKCVFSQILPVNIKKTLYAGNLELNGDDIQKHLENCTNALFMAVTLGVPIDNLIRKYEAVNMAKAIVIDTICNILIDDIADEYENKYRDKLKQENLYLTSRFSPGYGDLSINLQKNIISILDANRKIGLTVSDSGLLIPKKSITAILGIASIPVKGKLAGCKNCLLKEKCAFRKRGQTCY